MGGWMVHEQRLGGGNGRGGNADPANEGCAPSRPGGSIEVRRWAYIGEGQAQAEGEIRGKRGDEQGTRRLGETAEPRAVQSNLKKKKKHTA